MLGSYLQRWTEASAEGRYATFRGGGAGLGQFWTAPAPTPDSVDMHCFRQFRLRLRAPKGDRPGKNQPFFHFDFKICLHNISYHKTRQNAFVSRLLIPLDSICFRSRLAFFDGLTEMTEMTGPSCSGSVPSGSGSGWQHHFVTLIDVSHELWNSKKVIFDEI